MGIGYRVSSNTARYLEPTSGGNIDVVNNMRWTLTPKSGRIEVPTMHVTEYQQTTGQILAGIFYFKRLGLGGAANLLGNDDVENLYKFKYVAEPTGWKYDFPFFSDKKFTRNTQFDREDGGSPFSSLMDTGKKSFQIFSGEQQNRKSLISRAAGFLQRMGVAVDAGVGLLNAYLPGKFNLELPESWQSTNEGTTSVTFDLFNSGSYDELKSNRDLAYILTYQNSPSKRNFAIHDPVCIYDMWIGDVCAYPACYISSLNIKNLGNTRLVKIDGVERIIPEAYRFTIEFTPLLIPTRQILDGMDKGQLVSAITTSSDAKALEDSIQSASNSFSNAVKGALGSLNSTLGFSPGTLH